jgi:hypothetical protein
MIPNEMLTDTLVEARIERFHLEDLDLRHPAPSWAAPPTAGLRPWAAHARATTAGPSLRVRIGHGLLALGSAIAGEDAMGREAPGHAAPNHVRRAA